MPKQDGIFYTDTGEGFPIILIHGFCETHEVWNELASELARECRVICIDLPGFGLSELPPVPFTLLSIAQKINHLIGSLGISKTVVIGHSLGGYVTLAMIENDPQFFMGFGLFHSTALADSEEKKISRNKVIEFVTIHGVTQFIQSFVPPLFSDPNNVYINDSVSMGLMTRSETLIAYTTAMRDRPDRTNVLKAFNGPILFLAGELDTVINIETIKTQAKLAHTPILVTMQSVAHMGMYEDKLTSLNCLRGYLGSVGAI